MTNAPAEFIERTLARSLTLDDTLPAVRERRLAARSAIGRNGLPAGRIEQWKYTPITRFYDPAFADVADASAGASSSVTPLQIDTVASARLTGAAPDVIDATLPEGLTLTRFSEIGREQQGLLGQYLDRDIDTDRHPLDLVNLALLDDGLLVHVDADAHIECPVDLQFVTGPRAASCDRVLVVLGANSRLTLVEQHASTNARNQVVEIHLEPGAQLVHYRTQPAADANHWALVHTNVGAGARYRYHGYAFGGAPHRTEIHVRLIGCDAEATLCGALVARGREKLDHQLCIEHVAAGCHSHQQFHGIALERGELTFNGRIHIHPDAQQSDAQLSNRNLLGNDGARINTKPELEIYADDVKCAHGATVGQLSAAELFYLQSRGIPLSTARIMLLRGFIDAVLPTEPGAPRLDGLFEEVLRQWAG
jgi:Fe-S cluster assembly protein SufD